MTSDHLRSVFAMYLNQWGQTYLPKRQDTANLDPLDKPKVLSHAMWMCEQGLEFLKEEPRNPASSHILEARLEDEAKQRAKVEKAMRWLGFVQGVLFFSGVYTIDEMRAHSTSQS